jgi:ankyrin repeat protein
VYNIRSIFEIVSTGKDEIDWNAPNILGATPVYVSARFGSLCILKALLKCGVNVNIEGGHFGNALQAASFQGHTEIVWSLLQAGANPGQKGKFESDIHAALAGGHESTAMCLLQRHTVQNSADLETLLTFAALYSHQGRVIDKLFTMFATSQ